MAFPKTATPRLPVSPADYTAVIDLCNRFNLAADLWDVETMVSLFADDGAILHPRGAFRGHDGLRRFLDGYRMLTVATRRQGMNHVVDGNEDGTISVVFSMLILRVAEPANAESVREHETHRRPLRLSRNSDPFHGDDTFPECSRSWLALSRI